MVYDIWTIIIHKKYDLGLFKLRPDTDGNEMVQFSKKHTNLLNSKMQGGAYSGVTNNQTKIIPGVLLFAADKMLNMCSIIRFSAIFFQMFNYFGMLYYLRHDGTYIK